MLQLFPLKANCNGYHVTAVHINSEPLYCHRQLFDVSKHKVINPSLNASNTAKGWNK